MSLHSPLSAPNKVSRSSLWFALAILLLPWTDAWSARVSGLYQAEVPIAGEGTAQRNEAIGRAFADMLVKVTGNRRIVALGGLEQELGKASRYVQQYSYRMADPAREGGQTGEPQRYLKVFFDAGAVDRLLTERQLPVWSANRPSILVWMGMEERGKRRLLVSEQDPATRKHLEAAAETRGLPIIFPIMDLEDQGSLQVADLWGDFESNIRSASRRYGTDLILTGRLVEVSKGFWRGHWRLYQGQGVVNWNNQGNSEQEVAADGIQHLGDQLAGLFAPFGERGSGGALRVRISGVRGLKDYVAIGNLLRSQGGVERVILVAAESDALTFDLHGRSGVKALEQGLRLGGVMEPDPMVDTASETQDGSVLHYRIQ
jgi:hypothetical protein